MTTPRISVVTPSYNQAEFIEKTIQSVKEQEYNDVEHIVVDGGSTDGTLEILRNHEDDYNLRWISESDQGQTDALNKGIQMADGTWIGWLNSDDMYTPGAFLELENALSENPDAEVVYGDLYFVDEQGEVIMKRYHTRPSKFIQRYWLLFTANHCTFFHNSVFKKVGKLNPEYSLTMDAELFQRILNQGINCYHVPSFMGARRLHEATKTGQNVSETKEQLRRIRGVQDSLLPPSLLTPVAMVLKAVYILSDGLDRSKPESIQWSIKAAEYELTRFLRRRI